MRRGDAAPVVHHLRRLGAALDASPAELAGLALLLAGSLVVTLLVAAGGSSARGPAPVTVVAPASDRGTSVVVHVTGAVRQPGLVRLPSGARVADALAAAGGARTDAVLDALNLAAEVADGQQVLVPGAESATPTTAGPTAAAGDGRVDINRASAEELEALPGVGPVLAARIVAWREEHGPFEDPGALRAVPGIGERTFQAMADLVRV